MNQECQWILATSVVSTLGSGAKCSWVSPSKLNIIMGRDPSIKPGDEINLWEGQRVKSRWSNFRASPIAAPCQSSLCNGLCAGDNWLDNPAGKTKPDADIQPCHGSSSERIGLKICCPDIREYATGTIRVLPPYPAVTPFVHVKYVPEVGRCDSLVSFDISRSTKSGGRSFTVAKIILNTQERNKFAVQRLTDSQGFGIPGSVYDPIPAKIDLGYTNGFLTKLSLAKCDPPNVPKLGCVSAGYKYYFKVALTNFFGETAYSKELTLTVSNAATPKLVSETADTFSMAKSDRKSVQITAIMPVSPKCNASKLQYFWSRCSLAGSNLCVEADESTFENGWATQQQYVRSPQRFLIQNRQSSPLKPGGIYIYRVRVSPVINPEASVYKDFKVTISLSPIVVSFLYGDAKERVVGADEAIRINVIENSYDPDALNTEYPEEQPTQWMFEFSYKLSTELHYNVVQSDSSGIFDAKLTAEENIQR